MVLASSALSWIVLVASTLGIAAFHILAGMHNEAASRQGSRDDRLGLHQEVPMVEKLMRDLGDTGLPTSASALLNVVSQWSPFVMLPLLLVLGRSFSTSLYWTLAVYTSTSALWFVAAPALTWLRVRRRSAMET